MADSIAAQSSILSAVCKAKADTKDGADGSGWDKGESNGVSISTFLQMSQNTILLSNFVD